MKPTITANAKCRQYVQARKDFEGSHLYARTLPPTDNCLTTRYVVFSYGTHFPLFIAETGADGVTHWYENANRYSVTTSKHRSQSHPLCDTMPLTTDAMRCLVTYGISGVAVRRGMPESEAV